jgi:hypothetical protein
MGFSEPHSWTKNLQKKVIYSELLACFESGLLQQMKPGSLMDWGQRANSWNGSILILPGKKLEKVSVTGWGHDHSSGTMKVWFCWLRCLNGRQSTPMFTSGHWLNLGIISDVFSLTRVQQKSCFIMTLPGCIHVYRLRKPSQNMVWLYYPICPTASM